MTEDRLTRVRDGKIAAGVCTGLARRTGIDQLVYRAGFALLLFATGLGFFLYLAAWLLMPGEESDLSIVERVTHRVLSAKAVLGALGALLAGGVLIGVTGQGLFSGLNSDSLTTLTVLGLVVLVARTRGVDLAAVARSLPEQLKGTPVPEDPAAPKAVGDIALEPGWIDLAKLNGPRIDTDPYRSGPYGTGPSSSESSRIDPYRQEPALAVARRRSPLAPVTLLLGVMVAAAMIPVAVGRPADSSVQIVLAAALAVVGLGLVTGSGYGRPRGLVAVGTLLSLALVTTSVVGDVPAGGRYGDVRWRPVDVNGSQNYRVVAGGGRLDLTGLPLQPGQRLVINAEVGLGDLKITLPRDAQVELHATLGLGDVTVDKHITSGPRAKVDQVLPGSGLNPPVIELHVKGKIGDLEIRRG
jgi:phage shock protein PspC (stress-responsive transcriptional regulator)